MPVIQDFLYQAYTQEISKNASLNLSQSHDALAVKGGYGALGANGDNVFLERLRIDHAHHQTYSKLDNIRCGLAIIMHNNHNVCES